MIAYLNGVVLQKKEKYLIINVQSVGYQVFTTTNIISEMNLHDSIELFIHTHVREDEISLYGFSNCQELELFKLVLSVSGIGPKLGLEILNCPHQMVKNAIFSSDSGFLTKINGLGKKIAERMILELKNKVEPVFITHEQNKKGLENNKIDSDVIVALEGLGYSKYHIMKVLNRYEGTSAASEDMIKFFLQNV